MIKQNSEISRPTLRQMFLSRPLIYLGFLPIFLYIVFIAAASLVLTPERAAALVFDPPLLMLFLNLVFIFGVSIVVTVIAMKAYLSSGASNILLLGCGVLALGLAALSGGLVRPLGGTANTSVTIHNLGVLIAAVLNAGAVLVTLLKIRPQPVIVRPRNLLLGFGGTLALVALVAAVTLAGLIPPFWTAEAGSTTLKQIVLGSAIVLFILTSIHLFIFSVRGHHKFLYWYSLALTLTSTGLVGISLMKVVGDPIAWAGRTAQYVGAIYFLGAVLTSLREARSAGLTLKSAMDRFYRSAEVHFGDLVNTASDAIISLDNVRRILLWNPGAERMFGYTREEVMDRTGVDFLLPEHPKESLDATLQSLQDRKTDSAVTSRMEIQMRRKDGTLFFTETSLSVRSIRSNWVVTTLIVRDISERKHMEKALSKSYDELELRVQERTAQLRESEKIALDQMKEIETYYLSAPIGLCVLDTDLRYLRINERLAGWNGIPASEHLGRTLREVLPWLADKAEQVVRQVIETDKPVMNMEITAETPDQPGFQRIWLVDWHPIEDSTEKVVAISIVVQEVTQQRQLEDQLRQSQKMEAIGTLAGGIAHDFNNMLAAILGFTEMALEDISDRPDVEKNLQNVSRAAIRARDLVKQILTFSRKASYERSPLSLLPLIKETVQLLRASIPTTIEINFTATATSDTVIAAPIEIQQVLMNLATNASLAMQEKRGTLDISLTNINFDPDSPVFGADISPGEYVKLVVKDTGAGMSPDVMKRVFDPFFTTREVGKGTGMGLAVVYGIVRNLQGTITVESELGVGSTFSVLLPKVKTDAEAETARPVEIPGGNERILFVDDEEMLVEWGRATLDRLGYNVTAMTDSREALKTFSTDPSLFDLVITDHAMPQIAGAQFAKELLTIREDIFIILCTGHSDSISPESSREIGVKEFLTKPVSRQELAEVVRRVLDGKDLRAK